MPGKVEKTPAGRGARTGSGAGAGQEARTQALRTRQFALRRDTDGRPSTFDREARSVEVVATTESPVPVYDWEEGTIGEVLLMSGLKLPQGRQVPLQDTHDRWSVQSTLGSARNLRVDGDALIATVVFSSVAEAEDAMTKVEEGHITDFSVGWRQHKAVRIPKGESRIIAGREFKGPLKVVTSWSIKELSIVPIGADERAKARSESGAEYENTEGEKMNENLRKALEALGLKQGASDDEAWTFFELHGGDRSLGEDEALAFLETRAPGAPGAGAGNQARAGAGGQEPAARGAQPGEVETAAERAVQAVLKRAADTREICAHYGCPELADPLISAGKSLDDVRAAILDHLTGARQTDGLAVPAGQVQFGASSREKYRAAVVYSLIKRSMVEIKGLDEAAGWEDFRSYSLRELAREVLRSNGLSTRGGTIMSVVGDAFVPRTEHERAAGISDFGAILADVANKSLQAGFDDQPETYEAWTGEVSASDFKAMNLVSVTTLDGLLSVSEHGEFKYGYFRDRLEQMQLGTAGRIYPITRQAIINDDLSAITTVFAGAGAKARQYTGDLVYALLVSNPVMNEDNTTLFHADHGNIGTDGPVDVDTLNEMDALFAAQTDGNGGRLNIPMQFLIAPRGKRGGIETFFATKEYINANGLTVENIWKAGIERVYEPRLTGNGWYVAGPKGRTIVRAYLGGNKIPYTEQRSGWTVDGVELKVRHDVGVGVADWRAMAYNAGR